MTLSPSKLGKIFLGSNITHQGMHEKLLGGGPVIWKFDKHLPQKVIKCL